MSTAYDVDDMPLCEGDLIMFDMYMYGVDEDNPNRYVQGRIIRIEAASLCVLWLTGEYIGSSWNVSHEYVQAVIDGIAPKVPTIRYRPANKQCKH